jgi:hypothetical protein
MKKVKKQTDKFVLGTEQILELAKVQNKDLLYSTFPNIEYISDVPFDNKKRLTICIKDDNFDKIPKTVKVQLNKDTFTRVRTNIVNNAQPLLPASPLLIKPFGLGVGNNSSDSGSLCCLVRHKNDRKFVGMLTVAHNFSGYDIDVQCRSNMTNIGKLLWKHYDPQNNIDLAIIRLEHHNPKEKAKCDEIFDNFNNLSFCDPKNNEVLLVAQSGIKNARILSIKKNQIEIGIVKGTITSCVSLPGDSGGCVIQKHTGEMIGMLRCDYQKKYDIVIPVRKIKESLNKYFYL